MSTVRGGRIGGNRISVTLTDTQWRAINALVARGLFGRQPTDCVRRMIDEDIRRRCVEGWLPMIETGEKKR